MLRRLIDCVRWYFSEEERQPDMSEEEYQTDAFDRELTTLLSERTYDKTKEPYLSARVARKYFEMHKKYPKSLQMAQAKIRFDCARPGDIPPEDWESRWAEKWVIHPWEEETEMLAMLSRKPFIPLY